MRYLLIVENPGYTVKNRPHLLKELRAHLPVIALRIATRHMEVDVKGADPQEARKIVESVLGGSVVEVVDITFEEVKGGVEDYVRLFNQERFWEAHNALEGLWRSTRNPTLQGLIMLAAAFVKLQEGQLDKFETLIKEAVGLITEDVGCIRAEELREKALAALVQKAPFRIECS